MVTVNDLINIMTERELALLSSDGKTTPSSAILQSAIDRAYEYVLSYARVANKSATKETLPPIFDDIILQLAKYSLFLRNDLVSDRMIEMKRDIDAFLRSVSTGAVSVFDEKTEEDYAESGPADRSDLAYDKMFKF